ncbi:MAG: hypothetical protein OIF47_05310 [Marinibacterium sp.]|nr:hypothetical protein [Marinibacterium sp.]
MGMLLSIIGWAVAISLVVITAMLALNKSSGLKLIQHRTDMLPQVLLVRYGGMAVLSLLAAWFNAPRVLFSMLLAFAVIGLGDAFIYRRAGHPFWLHLVVGGLAGLGALLALFSIS